MNKEKSLYYLHQKGAVGTSLQVEQKSGMVKGSFPMKYLDCPITHTRNRKADYAELIDKVKGKLQVWKRKMLSYGENRLFSIVSCKALIYMLYQLLFHLSVL